MDGILIQLPAHYLGGPPTSFRAPALIIMFTNYFRRQEYPGCKM